MLCRSHQLISYTDNGGDVSRNQSRRENGRMGKTGSINVIQRHLSGPMTKTERNRMAKGNPRRRHLQQQSRKHRMSDRLPKNLHQRVHGLDAIIERETRRLKRKSSRKFHDAITFSNIHKRDKAKYRNSLTFLVKKP